MKLTLNKKKLKNLTKEKQALPKQLTPQVAGGTRGDTLGIDTLEGDTLNCATNDCVDTL